MEIIKSSAMLDVPRDVAVCPICGEPIYVEEIREWESETGRIVDASLNCTTEPDIDSDDWNDWFNWHFSMPYVDWLPLERPVLAWLSKAYRVQVDGGDGDDGL